MYGFVVTTAGQGMLARAAAGEAFTITSVQVGKGVVGSQAAALALTALVDPVANATSDEPEVNGNQMSLIVEYRNDLNGGLQEGFELSEFGIFASVGDDQPALLYYASLGDNPQPVQPESAGLDVHRFPVAIAVTGDISVALNYPDNAFVANKDFNAHVNNTSNPHGVKAGQVMTESGESVETALSNKADKGPPQVYDLPLAGGVTSYGISSYCKTQEDVVIVNFAVVFADVKTGSGSYLFATLPAGFRPNGVIVTSASAWCESPLGRNAVECDVRQDGGIYISTTEQSIQYVHGQVVFVAG